jgi:hypothetical protein
MSLKSSISRLAWAAGYFDAVGRETGEGHELVLRIRSFSEERVPLPFELEAFYDIVGALGRIDRSEGIFGDRSYIWVAKGRDAREVLKLLGPFRVKHPSWDSEDWDAEDAAELGQGRRPAAET